MSEAVSVTQTTPYARLRMRLRELYHGHSPGAVRFRLWAIVLDLMLIGFFVIAPFFRGDLRFIIADYVIAVIVAVEMLARAVATRDLKRWFVRAGAVDVIVLLTLLLPQYLANFAFLRVLRLWSLVHSDFFWETVARRYDDTRWEEVTKAVVTLVTYVFLVSGLVYALYARQHPRIEDFVDALYFTVTTISTTGFGDIVLPGTTGKLISIAMMVSGVGIFVRLAHAVFRPIKVRFPCPTCGLQRHDYDAVHCKACGQLLNIPNDEL